MSTANKNTRSIQDILRDFLQDSRSVGIVLLCCTMVSLLLANLPALSKGYLQLIDTEFHFPGWLHLPHTLLHWINDGAMALFFFQAGMEIKRELLAGELSAFKKAVLPVAAAMGGMLVPALLFVAFNAGSSYLNG